jgi:MYXO-CTERM domain-containing protein
MRWTVFASPVAAALLVTAGATAQTYDFVPLPGGAVTDLAYDPHTPGFVFAAVHGVGIYKSTDGGTTFEARPLPEVRAHEPRQLLPSTAEAGVVLVCDPNLEAHSSGGSNVYRSADEGETFTAVLTMGGVGCTALAESHTAGTYYAASGTTPKLVLYRSTDSGATWQMTALTSPSALFTDLVISALVELPSGRLVFGLEDSIFGSDGTGALAYSDDGVTLTQVTGPQFAVQDVAFNGTDTLFAFEGSVSDPYLWQSSDGATFARQTFGTGSDSSSPYTKIKYVPGHDTFLCLGGGRIIESSNRADGYQFGAGHALGGVGAANQLTDLSTMAGDPGDPNGFLVGEAAGGYGIVRGRGDPQTWALATGIGAARFDFALYDTTTGYQYLASSAGRVLFAEAGAASAREVFSGRFSAYEPITAMAYDLADPKHIVLGTKYGDGLDEEPRLLELADAVAAPNDKRDGQHAAWTPSADPMPAMVGASLAALLVDGMTRYVGYTSSTTGQYLYRSHDGGATYEQLSLLTDSGVTVLARDPTNPNVLYAGGGGDFTVAAAGTKGLFRSVDAGDTWTQLASDTKLATFHVSRIAIDPDHPDHVWAAGVGNAYFIWQTLDGGTTFTDITPLSSSSFTDIAYSASLGHLVVAMDDGVFTSNPSNGALTSLTTLYGQPLALYPDARGIATSGGLYVASDLVGVAGAGGASGAGDGSGGDTGLAGRGGTNGSGGSANSGAGTSVGGSVSVGGGVSVGASSSTGGGAGQGGSSESGAGGGAGASGGTGTSGGSGGSSSKETSGCACHVGRDGENAGGALVFAFLALVGVRRRRTLRLRNA